MKLPVIKLSFYILLLFFFTDLSAQTYRGKDILLKIYKEKGDSLLIKVNKIILASSYIEIYPDDVKQKINASEITAWLSMK